MQLTYDPAINIAYIRFKSKRGKVRTIAVSDQLNIDIAADGSIYGMELLNANEQLSGGRHKKLIIKNAASGKSAEFALNF